MKKISVILLLMSMGFAVFAQENDCDDPNKISCCQAANKAIIAIPPLSELKCKDQKAGLYKILPKIPIYKGFLFNEIRQCSENSKSGAILEFQYCIAETRLHMTITICDFNDPFYKTDVGQSQVNLYQALFMAGVTPVLRTYPSKNKVFDKSYIAMPEKEKYVSFEGLYKNRYYVHLVIDGDRFKLATEVDAFLEDYIKAFNF